MCERRSCWPKFYKGRICARKAPLISQRLPLKFKIHPQTWWLERWNCRDGIFLQQSWFSGKWPGGQATHLPHNIFRFHVFVGYLFPSTKVGTCFVRRCYVSKQLPWTKYHMPSTPTTFNFEGLWPIWVFPKIGDIPKWVVYIGNPYKNGWFGGTPTFRNTHILRA